MPSPSSNGSPNLISEQYRVANASLASLIGYMLIRGKYVEEVVVELEALERQFERDAIISGYTVVNPALWAVQNALKNIRQNIR